LRPTLVGVGKAAHAGHDTEDVVVGGVYADLGGLGALNGGVGKNKLESGVVDSGEVAGARWLVLFWAKGEGVDVDAGVWGASVVLVRLDKVEVGSLALREAVLAVKLKLGSDNGVLAPAVHVEGGLGEDERAGVRYVGFDGARARGKVGLRVRVVAAPLCAARVAVHSAGGLEKTGGIDESLVVTVQALRRDRVGAAERVDGVGEGIDGVGVVEWLGTEGSVEELVALEGGTVINVLIGLDNPDKFFDGVVEVKFDLVGGRSDGFITSELNLFDEVFVGVLGHASALISVKENVVNVKGGRYKRLVVGGGDLGGSLGA